MERPVGVSYSQWLEYVSGARQKGFRSQELNALKTCFPSLGEAQFYLAEGELAGLENVLLKGAIQRFQKLVNLCMEEGDLENLDRGLRELKRNIASCFFFSGIREYPMELRENLSSQMAGQFLAFWEEYSTYVKKLRENDSSGFAEDFAYLCQKAKLKKYVEGFVVHG